MILRTHFLKAKRRTHQLNNLSTLQMGGEWTDSSQKKTHRWSGHMYHGVPRQGKANKTTLKFHLTSAWPRPIKQRAANTGENVEWKEPSTLLMGAYTGTATVQICRKIPRKAKDIPIHGLSQGHHSRKCTQRTLSLTAEMPALPRALLSESQ